MTVAPPLLQGPRIHLRPLRPDDVDALHALFGDPQVTRYWSFAAWTRRDQAQRFLDERLALPPPAVHGWAIADEQDVLIGTLTLFVLDGPPRRGEIGYALRSDRQRLGLAAEALRLAIGFAFDALGLGRIEADVDPRNVSSLRLLERLGFRREALLHDRCRAGNEIGDAAIYGLLREDWRGERDA